MPVQVDGEPWIQSPGEVVIMKSALKVSPEPLQLDVWAMRVSITIPRFP